MEYREASWIFMWTLENWVSMAMLKRQKSFFHIRKRKNTGENIIHPEVFAPSLISFSFWLLRNSQVMEKYPKWLHEPVNQRIMGFVQQIMHSVPQENAYISHHQGLHSTKTDPVWPPMCHRNISPSARDSHFLIYNLFMTSEFSM